MVFTISYYKRENAIVSNWSLEGNFRALDG